MTQEKKMANGIKVMDDGKIKIRATARDAEGKQIARRATLPAGTTMAEAKLRLAELRIEAETAAADEEAPITTLADYAEQWVSRRVGEVRPSVIDGDLVCLTHHILPQLGHLALAELTRQDILDWRDWVHAHAGEGDYAAATVGTWWRTLKKFLRDAHADGLCGDVLLRVKAPRTDGLPSRRERRTLTHGQLGALIEASQDTPWYAEVVTLAYTGMRLGELYGLHWSAIDLDTCRASIEHSASKGRLEAPKTGHAREVYLPPVVVDALRAHRRQQLEDQAPGLEHGIVFPSTVGTYRQGWSVRKAMEKFSEAAGIGYTVTPQVLRRTFNTLMVEANVNAVVLRSQIGHSDEAMTQLYAGVHLDAKAAAWRTVFKEE